MTPIGGVHPQSKTPMRPSVAFFAFALEARLRRHDKKRGNTWTGLDTLACLARAQHEIGELTEFLHVRHMRSLPGRKPSRAVLDECVDVAAYMMMLGLNDYRRQGGLVPQDPDLWNWKRPSPDPLSGLRGGEPTDQDACLPGCGEMGACHPNLTAELRVLVRDIELMLTEGPHPDRMVALGLTLDAAKAALPSEARARGGT